MTPLLPMAVDLPWWQGAQATAGGSAWLSDVLKVYMPRRMCMFYEQDVIWTHAVSDALIAVSYFSIPIALAYFVRRRRDVAFGGVFWLFAAFIMLCGLTHVFGVWALWQPLYRLDGWVKGLTGVVSASTAVVLWRLMPQMLRLPSPAQLRTSNEQLWVANQELTLLRDKLEGRVGERTAELSRRSAELEATNIRLAEANQRLTDANSQLEQANVLLRKAHEQENQLRREAERLNRSKDEFLSVLGHELRTPLNAMLGWAQILGAEAEEAQSESRKSVDRDTVAEAAETIERNCRSQATLVDDLLDMGRIVSGQLRLRPVRTAMGEPVRAAVETVMPAAEAKGVHVRVVFDDDAELRPIIADPDRLQQVTWNLLSNAVKFTRRGGEVAVSVRQEESQMVLKVRDNGEGISHEFLPRLFNAFEQADSSAARRRGGLGLGLSICKRLVELHGGTIEAHSDGPEMGATFTVFLPIRAAFDEAQADEKGSDSASPASTTPAIRSGVADLRVLVVEDEVDSRRAVQRVLDRAGATVTTAAAADEALVYWSEPSVAPPFDLMISDIGMPGMDGYELMRRLRAWEQQAGAPRMPALALTAYARREDQAHALAAGFDDHCAKPVDRNELLRRVHALGGVNGQNAG